MSEQRGQWSGRLGFILAAAGSAIGLGNLWRFPYITYQNHGGAFVLMYLVAVLVVGFPIMMAEIMLGRRSQQSPVGAFRVLAAGKPGGRLWPLVGFLGVTAGFVILSFYSVVAGWTLHFILISISGKLGTLAHEPALLAGYFNEDFLANGRLQIVYHLVFMALTTGAVFYGVKGGIERVARILMPSLFVILAALVVYVALQSGGFGKALVFLFRPDFGEVSSGAVLDALGQAFFSLSLGMGCMLTYGSYMSRENSIPKSALQVSILDSLMGIVASVIMFSIIFGHDMEVGESFTILFTTLPTVLTQLPAGSLMSTLFYVLVAFAALTSTISLLEVVSSYAIDELRWPRRRAALTMGAAIALFGILNALSLGGSATLSSANLLGKEGVTGVFGALEYLSANWFLPVGGLLIAVFVGWFLSGGTTREVLETGHGELRGYGVWRFCIRFVAPIAVGAIIVSVILGATYS